MVARQIALMALLLLGSVLASCAGESERSNNPNASLPSEGDRSTRFRPGSILGPRLFEDTVDVGDRKVGYIDEHSIVIDQLALFPRFAGKQSCHRGGLLGLESCTVKKDSDPRGRFIQLVSVDPTQPINQWNRHPLDRTSAVNDGKFQYRFNVSPTKQGTNRCFALVDATGETLKIRDGDGNSAYLFGSPVAQAMIEAEAAEQELKGAQNRINDLNYRADEATRMLGKNPAWQASAGTCTTPAMRALPAPPDVPTGDALAVHATGFCVELMKRRHNEADVYAALRAAFLDPAIAINQQWRYETTPACVLQVGQARSNTDDWLLRMFGSLFGQVGMMGAMQEGLATCINQVQSGCNSYLQTWQRQVAEIRAEPGKQLTECQEDVQLIQSRGPKIAEISQTIPALERRLAEAKARLAPLNPRADLEDAECRYAG